MRDLAIVCAFYFIVRWQADSLVNSFAMTLFLTPFMMIAYFFGGWTSFANAKEWLRKKIGLSILIAVGMTLVVVVGYPESQHTVLMFASELITAYFFFHATLAIGDWFIRWIYHRMA